MFRGLRTRLLLSYVVIVFATLCIVAVALTVFLIRSPLPTQFVYNDLSTIVRSSGRYLRVDPDTLDQRLAAIAEDNEVRTLRVTRDQTVNFDSAGEYAPGDTIEIQGEIESEGPLSRGAFRDPNARLWLFIATGVPDSPPDSRDFIVFARQRPVAAASTVFGESVLGPIFQAGVLGVCVSLVFALLIASWIARPLRKLAEAAKAIARGEYQQRVPEQGPREVRELAVTFNDMAEQVQRTHQTQHDFLANVSHELKTPLTSIQGYSQAILDGAAADPTRAAKVIHTESGRMRRMVEELLDLARLESGQTQLRRQYIDFRVLLDGILERMDIQAIEKGVQLSNQVNPLPRMTGDGDRLAQIFTNLIANAITHTPAGGSVSVSAHQQDGGVHVVVQDTGPGIPEEDISRIFERFYQVDKSRVRDGRKGTGLGLTITRELVEAHGGTIHAESPDGQGAAFHVWLPLPRPHDETVMRGLR